MYNKSLFKTILVVVFILFITQASWSYVGPGTGLSAIGIAIALILGIILLVIGFIIYPLKKLFGKKKEGEPDKVTDAD